MFRLCARAALTHPPRPPQVNITYRCVSTSPVKLGILQKVNEKYERYLERQFPRFFIYYHTLTRGFQLLLSDVREVRRIRRTMRRNNVPYQELPYRDMKRLVLFRQDVFKAVPLLVISLPPFAIGFVLLLMCLFPRQLLFRHFWTLQQQRKFQAADHARRARCQTEVLRNLVWTVPHVSGWRQRTLLLQLCSKVQSGSHPSVSELSAVRDLFSAAPLDLQTLEPSHIRFLGSQLSMIVWLPSFLLRRRISSRALDLLHLDRALKGLGLDQLTEQEMRQACDHRGLNPSDLSATQCREWLQQWLQLSTRVRESESSLLLHSMTLLTLNYAHVPQ